MISFPYTSVKTLQGSTVSYDRAVNSKVKRLYNKLRYKQGVTVDVGGGFQVVADTGMNVKVMCNGAWGHVGGNFCYEEAESRVLAVQAPDTTYDRIDLVVLRNDISQEKRAVDLYVVQGTPASSPEKPALTNTPEIQEICIATLFITKNVNTISQDRITDTRLDPEVCGILTNAFGDIDASAFFSQINALIKKHQEDAENQIKELQAAIEAVEGDSAWMMQSLYDKDGFRRDIFSDIPYSYKATFTAEGWSGDGTYTQTAQLTAMDGGPAVAADSILLASIGTDSTLSTDEKEAAQMAAALIAKGSKTLGSDAITVSLEDKPGSDVTVYFRIRKGAGHSVPALDPVMAEGIKLLWTNPARESPFSAKKVSLDLSAWKFILITIAYGSATLIPVGLSGRISASEGSSANPVSTRLFNSDSTGIDFKQGLYAGGQGGWSDQAAVPYQIFGVNL